MSFEIIVTQLDFHIFMVPPTFYNPAIDYDNLKVGHWVYITVEFFGHSLVKKFVGCFNYQPKLPLCGA